MNLKVCKNLIFKPSIPFSLVSLRLSPFGVERAVGGAWAVNQVLNA